RCIQERHVILRSKEGGAVADDAAENFGTPCTREVHRLENEERGALAEASTIASEDTQLLEREKERLAHRLTTAGQNRRGASRREEDVGARDSVEGTAVSIRNAHVERAQLFPDAHVAAGAVRDGVRKLRRVDVSSVFEDGDAIELGDRLETSVRV